MRVVRVDANSSDDKSGVVVVLLRDRQIPGTDCARHHHPWRNRIPPVRRRRRHADADP